MRMDEEESVLAQPGSMQCQKVTCPVAIRAMNETLRKKQPTCAFAERDKGAQIILQLS